MYGGEQNSIQDFHGERTEKEKTLEDLDIDVAMVF